MRNSFSKPSVQTVSALSAAINLLLAKANAFYLLAAELGRTLNAAQPYQYHLLFDQVAGQVLGIADKLSARVRQMGGIPIIGEVTDFRNTRNDGHCTVCLLDILGQVTSVNAALVLDMRETRRLAAERGDKETSRLLDILISLMERQTWSLLRAAELQRRATLVGRAADAREHDTISIIGLTRGICNRKTPVPSLDGCRASVEGALDDGQGSGRPTTDRHPPRPDRADHRRGRSDRLAE